MDLWAIARHHEFYFNGQWMVPGWRLFYPSYLYIAAPFVADIIALWIDRLIMRWQSARRIRCRDRLV